MKKNKLAFVIISSCRIVVERLRKQCRQSGNCDTGRFGEYGNR